MGSGPGGIHVAGGDDDIVPFGEKTFEEHELGGDADATVSSARKPAAPGAPPRGEERRGRV
ncbi:MAG: hypothetical protein ACE5G2_01710, partial [Candidatus Krumholzibacteriia bacterium]